MPYPPPRSHRSAAFSVHSAPVPSRAGSRVPAPRNRWHRVTRKSGQALRSSGGPGGRANPIDGWTGRGHLRSSRCHRRRLHDDAPLGAGARKEERIGWPIRARDDAYPQTDPGGEKPCRSTKCNCRRWRHYRVASALGRESVLRHPRIPLARPKLTNYSQVSPLRSATARRSVVRFVGPLRLPLISAPRCTRIAPLRADEGGPAGRSRFGKEQLIGMLRQRQMGARKDALHEHGSIGSATPCCRRTTCCGIEAPHAERLMGDREPPPAALPPEDWTTRCRSFRRMFPWAGSGADKGIEVGAGAEGLRAEARGGGNAGCRDPSGDVVQLSCRRTRKASSGRFSRQTGMATCCRARCAGGRRLRTRTRG